MTDPEWTTEQRWADDEDWYSTPPDDALTVRDSGPGTLTAGRQVWDGCPRGFHPPHDGPCP